MIAGARNVQQPVQVEHTIGSLAKCQAESLADRLHTCNCSGISTHPDGLAKHPQRLMAVARADDDCRRWHVSWKAIGQERQCLLQSLFLRLAGILGSIQVDRERPNQADVLFAGFLVQILLALVWRPVEVPVPMLVQPLSGLCRSDNVDALQCLLPCCLPSFPMNFLVG